LQPVQRRQRLGFEIVQAADPRTADPVLVESGVRGRSGPGGEWSRAGARCRPFDRPVSPARIPEPGVRWGRPPTRCQPGLVLFRRPPPNRRGCPHGITNDLQHGCGVSHLASLTVVSIVSTWVPSPVETVPRPPWQGVAPATVEQGAGAVAVVTGRPGCRIPGFPARAQSVTMGHAAPFPAPPPQTVHEVLPHTAFPQAVGRPHSAAPRR
jgi:hypothetical protein